MMYLPPRKQSISPSAVVPNNVPSKTGNVNSSFKISVTKSASNGNIYNEYGEIKTPEKYFSRLNSSWKTTDSVAKVKRGKSAINLRLRDSPSMDGNFNIVDNLNPFDEPRPVEKRFNKSFLKRKLAKLFKSTGKLNQTQIEIKTACLNDKIKMDGYNPPVDLPNDALRNLSFTAAMMGKDSAVVAKSRLYHKIEDKKQIPPSTLKFWKKPSEEKMKASHRRTQDNIYGSNEILLRINSNSDAKKIPSEISLFTDEMNSDSGQQFGKGSVVVDGYDKAFQTYRNIVSQSQHISRRAKAMSVAYGCEDLDRDHRVEMRNWQSSSSVNVLAKNHSSVYSPNDDSNVQSTPSDQSRNPPTQPIIPLKRFPNSNQHKKPNIPSISPPAYDKNALNSRRSRSKIVPLTTAPPYPAKPNHHQRAPSTDYINRQCPKPPPRSDSLIRSFELICKNLQTSITEPRGDSFKIFKNQHDYQAWLKNLPYHNPDKISTLLRQRSKLARRQCVSELLDVDISDLNLNSKRRYSWPLQKSTNILSDSSPTKRSNSLSRMKNKNKPIEETKTHLDSPSLHNYSRLYCLRNSSAISPEKPLKTMPAFPLDSSLRPRASLSSIKSSAFILQNRRSGKHRFKPENNATSRMTLSYHEMDSNSFI